MTAVRVGSMFSGYGGAELGLSMVMPDARPAWFCEFDDAPSRILAHHWPDVPNHRDVTSVDWSTVEPVDVLTGGFPCQDVSVAGRRAGMKPGTRSGLWAHMRYAIDQLRPGLVIIENVGGLFSAQADSRVEPCTYGMGDDGSGGHTVFLRAADAVLGDLASLGFDAEWTALRAADVGAPHGRLRVFIVAYPQGQPWRIGHRGGGAPADTSGGGSGGRALVPGSGREGGPDAPALGADPRPDAPGGPAGLTLLPTPAAARAGRQRSASAGAAVRPTLDSIRQLLPTPSANLGANGGPQHPDKRRAGGHSVSIEDAVHGLLLPTPTTQPLTGNGHARHLGGEVALLPTPRAVDHEATMGSPGAARHVAAGNGSLAEVLGVAQWGDYAPAIARWEQILGRPAPSPTEPGKTRPRLSAAFVEWLMGLPDGHVTAVPGITRNQQLKALGNGIVPQRHPAGLRPPPAPHGRRPDMTTNPTTKENAMITKTLTDPDGDKLVIKAHPGGLMIITEQALTKAIVRNIDPAELIAEIREVAGMDDAPKPDPAREYSHVRVTSEDVTAEQIAEALAKEPAPVYRHAHVGTTPTAEDFTQAARAYAEEWNRHAEEFFNLGEEGAHGVDEESLIAGAEWARTYLAAQEATDAEVEAAARVIDPHAWSVYDRISEWERGTGNYAPAYPMAELVGPSMCTARAALSAARAARRDEETDR